MPAHRPTAVHVESPRSDPLLAVRGLRVSYGGVDAVKGIDLEVGQGEAVGLLGANGAGKTSTLRAISRLAATSGTIDFCGRPLVKASADSVARQGLVHVPEGRRLFSSLSAEENLRTGAVARGRRPEVFTLDEVYDLFPALVALQDRPAWALSGGEQQMVAIGRGLLAAPRLLLLDEPSLGLAPVVVTAVYRAVASIVDRVSVILVEQNAALALEVCDRAYVLAAGRITLAGRPEELGDREALMASYVAPPATDPAWPAERPGR